MKSHDYYLLSVKMKGYTTLFFRDVLVREDVSLQCLHYILGTIIGSTFEHCGMFEDDKYGYTRPDWVIDSNGRNKDYTETKISDIRLSKKRSFTYIYDTGDYYCFLVTILNEGITLNDDRIAILLYGKGQCIWEDYRCQLGKFLKKEPLDEEDGQPWNYEITTLEDYLGEIDIEEYPFDNEMEPFIDEDLKEGF